jgi:hypothetical protein
MRKPFTLKLTGPKINLTLEDVLSVFNLNDSMVTVGLEYKQSPVPTHERITYSIGSDFKEVEIIFK